MKIGTKSILFGAHCFFIHPIFVFIAWWKLYGFPFDLRLWTAFFVHDLGYWEKPNMDGKEGKTHPEFGAELMHKWFDKKTNNVYDRFHNFNHVMYSRKWYYFTLYHSRFLAKKENNGEYSKLCVADKLSITLEPKWFYLTRVILSGEIKEYKSLAKKRESDGEKINKYESMNLNLNTTSAWYDSVMSYLKRWVDEHKDLKRDTWTPEID
jgi:hypothetical protein